MIDKSKLRIRCGRRINPIKQYIPHDVSIKGSYYTGNIGDRAIGNIIHSKLEERGLRTFLFHKRASRASSWLKILGGGGVLHDWQGVEMLKQRLQFLSEGDMIIGVGVPGLESNEAKKFVRAKLNELDLITVRDTRSKRVLERATDSKVVVTACPAFLYDDPKSEVTFETGVNFRPWFDLDRNILSMYFEYDDTIKRNAAKKRYIKNAQKIINEVEDPVFIPFHKKDEEFAREKLDIPILEYDFSVKKTLDRVSKTDKMVTTRYHSLVFSSICRKPILPIAYAPKVTSLCERINLPAQYPHTEVNVCFEQPENIGVIKKSAMRNFSLIDEKVGIQKSR